MKKFNRTLSLVVCFTMFVCFLPSVLPVSSAEVTENIVSVDETSYDSIEDAVNWREGKDTKYTTLMLDENEGYITLYHDDEYVFDENGKVVGIGTNNAYRDFKDSVVAVDEDNSTYLTADMLKGKYRIDISIEALMNVDPNASTPYWSVEITNQSGNTMVLNRLFRNSTDFMSSSSASSDIMKGGSVKVDFSVPTQRTLTYIIDTETGDFEGYTDDSSKESCVLANIGEIKELKLYTLTRVGIGSYIKFRNIKVTQLSLYQGDELQEKLAVLPETLVEKDEISAVKDDIVLPVIDGITWSSSDNSIVDAETGKVTRSKGKDQSVTLTATFTADGIIYSKNYKMTVMQSGVLVDYYADGEKYQQIEIKKGNVASSISAPKKEHYTFVGWYNKATDEEFDFSTVLYDDVELYAKYIPKTYDVIFKADGETIETLTGKYGSVVDGVIPEIPAKSGYTAVNWMIGETEKVFSESTLIDGEMVINAKYIEGERNIYTVTFMADGSVYAEQTVIEGFAVGMPKDPEKENYKFDKWQLNGADYIADNPVTDNITLNAVFKPAEMSVTFYDEDKTTKLYTGTGYYMEKYSDFPENPTKEGGWKFDGWVLENGEKFDSETVVEKPVSVYAVYVSSIKVIYDKDLTQIKNNIEAVSEGWIFASTEHTEAGVFEDGGIGIWQIKCTPLSTPTSANSTQETVLGAKFKGTLEEDSENRTKINIVNIKDKYQIDIGIKSSLTEGYPDDYTGPRGLFALLTLGKNDGKTPNTVTIGPLTGRISSNYITPFNASSASGNTFKALSPDVNGDYTFHVLTDTRSDQVTVWVDDNASQTGKVYSESDYFNSISLKSLQRFGVGSYVKFTDVKITLIEEDTQNKDYIKCMETLEKLPDSLCNDPYNVVGDINIPNIDNVTWSTSAPAIVSADGTVNRWYDDYEVTVTANVKSGTYYYEKEYKLTVLARDGIVSEVLLDNKFESESDMLNWDFKSMSDSTDVQYSVDENGVKIEKISAPSDLDNTSNKFVYNALFDLYSAKDRGIYIRDHKGVYDIDISALTDISSASPAVISFGRRSGESFYNAFTLNFSAKGTYLTYRATPESEEKFEFVTANGTENDYKLRIDTENNKMWLFLNGSILTANGIVFSNTLTSDGNFAINSIRISVNENNYAGDNITINSVKLTKYEEEVVADMAAAVSAAKKLADDTVSSTPDNLEGYINNLPLTIDGYDVEWKSNTDQIDMQTGEVFHANNSVNAVVSAYVFDSSKSIPVVVRRDYNVIIRAAQSEQELAKYELNSLGKISNQPYDDIRYDINLPQVDGVEWTSSNTDVLTKDGEINRDIALYEDTTVTVTASKNGVSKEFPITVKKYTPFNDIINANSITTDGISIKSDEIENVKFSGDVFVNLSLDTGKTENISFVDSKGNIILKIKTGENGISFDYSSSSGKSIPTEGTAEIAVYIIPETGRMAIWMNSELIADYVQFKDAAADFAKITSDTDNNGVKSIEIMADSYTVLKSNVDNIQYFGGIEKGYVINDVNLKTDTIFGTKAEWNSDNETLIDSDGNVTNPDSMKFATLTLTLTDSKDESITSQYSRKVAVDAAEDKNIASEAIVTVSSHESLDAPKKYINDNNINTAFSLKEADNLQYVIYDFGKTVYFSTVYVNYDGGLKDYEIFISDNLKDWKSVKTGTFTDNIESSLINIGGIRSAGYIRLAFNNSTEKTVDIREMRVYLDGSEDELAMIDIDTILLPKTASADIELPAEGPNGTKFVWSTSNADVIDAGGKLTIPKETVTVVLTVSAADGKFTKNFEVKIKGNNSSDGPSVVGGGGSSGGGGGAGGSLGVGNSGLIDSVKPGDTFTTDVSNEVDNNTVTNIYKDVADTDWYYEPIKVLSEKGIVSGDGTGYFRPSDYVTREQLVKMILLATETELSDSENTFDDVEKGVWYEQYITTAKENGIIYGITDSLFGIGSNVTRQDMAAIIARLLEKRGYTFESTTEKFADDGEISDYAYNAVYAMKGLGIVKGYQGTFNPKSNLTRAEAAQVIASLIEFLEEK